MAERLVTQIHDRARALMTAFWPGPLTLLLPRSPAIPDIVTAGRPLVGIRMPAHPVALELIRRAGVPIAAPSANVFGHTSPTTAAHVLADLDGRIDAILDAGPAIHGVESTVLDPNRSPMIIYRPGAVTAGQIRTIAGPVEAFHPAPAIEPESQESLPSPGVGIRHYAPRARLVLVDASFAHAGAAIAQAVAALNGERIGVLLPADIDSPVLPESAIVLGWGRWSAPEEMARTLYAGLRELDERGCTVVVCPVPPPDGIGAAIRDRLQKAARPAGK